MTGVVPTVSRRSSGLTKEAARAFAAAVDAALPVGAVIPVLRGLLGASSCLVTLGAAELAEAARRIYTTVADENKPTGVDELASESEQNLKQAASYGAIELSPTDWCQAVEERLADR